MITRAAAKAANFGTPAMYGSPELVWLLCYLMYETDARRHYAEEREHPEFVDLGGES